MNNMLFYISDTRIGAIRPDGSSECYTEFTAPNQVHWQMGYIFHDGLTRIIACFLVGVIAMLAVGVAGAKSNKKEQTKLTDMLVYFAQDATRIGVIKPDGTGESYPMFGLPQQSALRMSYVAPDGKTLELINLTDGKYWLYDVFSKTLTETKQRRGELLPDGKRYLYTDNSNNVFTIYTADADGENRDIIYKSEGYAYGVETSRDKRKVAFHITGTPGRPGYEIYVVDIKSKKSKLIISDIKYIHFAPMWSPDGKWLLYERCAYQTDPGHDRSDLCLSKSDGSQQRVLTTGQSHWFAAAIGTPERHSSGSNVPEWSPDGKKIACALLLPDSQTAWPYQADRPDTDHFNRDYHPELARGGTQICLIDVKSGKITPLTHDDPPTWYFRVRWSPDGKKLAFMRADVGKLPELWVMNSDGTGKRFLTKGLNATGADHVRWIRLAVPSL